MVLLLKSARRREQNAVMARRCAPAGYIVLSRLRVIQIAKKNAARVEAQQARVAAMFLRENVAR